MQPQAFAIETEGLSKHFGQHRAVDTLNLSIYQGSIFGFLGPNGAGKTTTIRMLLGLIGAGGTLRPGQEQGQDALAGDEAAPSHCCGAA